MDKRTFIKRFSLLGLGTLSSTSLLANLIDEHSDLSFKELAADESFWSKVRSHYKLNPDYINLENGYYCMMPEETLSEYIEYVRLINFEASRYMRVLMKENNAIIRKRLADMAGCNKDELIITRNTTESLDLVIGGLDWKKGDEAIMALQDYGAMLNMFRLMEERHGIINKKISIPNHPKSDDFIVELYRRKITERTKLIMVSHVVNINGQVMPVRKICDMAHEMGVEVMVDGAHSFAHLNFKLEDLNCDYFGTSLHKWLSAPLGCGFLYVKKDKVKKLWPLFAEDVKPKDDIDRLSHTGTTPVHVQLGIANAIDYHNVIGSERKEERLKYLKQYWTNELRETKNVIINTPYELERSCGIANVGINGLKPKTLANILFEQYSIWTVAIERPGVYGCRITPNLYTTTEELDKFVAAIQEIASKQVTLDLPVK